LKAWIAAHGLERHIRILGLLPAGEQLQLVRRAAALVQPSLFEGWSTVVEEARALGKTVFLSDLPVHREQNPPGARYFPPRDAGALADLIAAEWEALPPGPQAQDEQAAREAQAGRVRDYAETFMRVAREAIASA
jgi:glycosyltransferase involved in cell wall biosynthesis